MFDWPVHNQTSPIRISCSIILFLPDTSMVYGPPAFIGANWSFHLPSLPVVVLYVLLLNLTLIFSPPDAHPHTFIFASRCNTMLSLIMRGSFIWALENNAINNKAQVVIALKKNFIDVIVI